MKVTLRSKSVLCAGASALVMSAVAPVATAQDQDDGQRTLSTVTVTATQRAESIQDVPIAVTALDPEVLERAGVADVTSLDSVAPSFNMNSSDTTSGGTTLRIRGIGTTGNNIGLESSVGVFLDGVYLSRPGVALTDLLDLEQLEVLRGPQGTLFGRNTSAGALNIKTKKPNLEEYEGFVNLTLGNFDLANVQAGINIPIARDKVALRISAANRTQSGFINGLNGAESHDRDRFSIRGQLLGDFGQLGTVRAILDHSRVQENCCHAIWFQDTTAAAVFAVTPGFAPDGGAPFVGPQALEDLQSNDENFFNPYDQVGFSLEYNVDTPIGALTYIGSSRNYDSDSFRNTDYTQTRIFTVGASPEAMALGGANFDDTPRGKIKTETHELRLQGTAFEDRLDWLVGVYSSDETIDTRGSLTLLDQYQPAVSAGLLGSPVDLLTAFAGGVDATGDFATNAFLQEGESFSIFTHNIFSVTDRFDVTVGVRYVEEEKDGQFEQIEGEFDACLGTFGNIANVPTALSGTAVALNCFVFAAPAFDPANPGPLFGAIAQSPAAALLGLLPQEFDDTFEDDEVVYTIKGSYK